MATVADSQAAALERVVAVIAGKAQAASEVLDGSPFKPVEFAKRTFDEIQELCERGYV